MPAHLRWNGDRARRFVLDRVTGVLDSAGRQAVERARQLCPVDTGNLRSSIGHTVVASRLKLTIYADAFYALFVELGTRFMEARPFLRPAIAEMNRFLRIAVNSRIRFTSTPQRYGGPSEIEG